MNKIKIIILFIFVQNIMKISTFSENSIFYDVIYFILVFGIP